MILIPQSTKQFSQLNSGDTSGNIYITKNISFDENGYLTLEKRTRNIFDSDTYTDLISNSYDVVHAIAYTSNSNRPYWFLGTKSLYYMSGSGLTLTKDVTAGTPTLSSSGDMCTFRFSSTGFEYLCVVKGVGVFTHMYFSGTWSIVVTDVIATVLCPFPNLDCLAVGGENRVQLIDGTLTKSTLLTLPIDYTVTSMDWNNNKLYIGTKSSTGNEAFIFEWDGTSSEANFGHPMGKEVQQVFSVKRYRNGVIAALSNGQLVSIDGSISEIANLPIYKTNKQWTYEGSVGMEFHYILNRGMIVSNDEIYIALNSSFESTQYDSGEKFFENIFPSGIWCYDPKVGLYHRWSLGSSLRVASGAVTTANVNTTTDVITLPSAIVPDTGTPVFYDDGSSGLGTTLSPLKWNTRYFVIKLSSTTMKLATTRANALAGTAIDLTTTGNNAQTFIFYPNDDFGGIKQYPRALEFLRHNSGYSRPRSSEAYKLLISSQIIKSHGIDSSSAYNVTGIHTIETKQENRGYFITPKLFSANVNDSFKKLYLKYNHIVNADDKIIIKYRYNNSNLSMKNLYRNSVGGTWVNSTSFTTTDPLFSEVVVGNEIEITNGPGAGYLAHITAISGSGTYTVTIDETVENVSAGQTFDFTVDNWIKQAVITSEDRNGIYECNIGVERSEVHKWLQVKVELRGEDVQVEELQVINQVFKPSA